MPDFEDPVRLHTYLEFVTGRSPDVAGTGKARLWWDHANSLLKMSVSGGAFSQIAALSATGVWVNAALATPKVTIYQETVGFAAFTDGGGAAGTYALGTTIPAGARFLYALVTGITGFTGDVSAALIIGDGADTDRYMTGTPSVFTTAAAGVDLGVPSGTAWHTTAKTPTLTITSGSDWGLVVAGSVTITLTYLAP